MLEMCSGIYLVLAVITLLLFRVTLLEAPWHNSEDKGDDTKQQVVHYLQHS
jgi:hypothetical protein